MNIQKYIESGVLEEYCLGTLNEADQAYLIQMTMLYPEIKAELTVIELAIEKLAIAAAQEPDPAIREKILASLGFGDEDEPGYINDLPAIGPGSDPQIWLDSLKHLLRDELTEDFSCRVFRKDEQVQQMLVISKKDIPEEAHGDYLESFLVLKGQCACTVGDHVYHLGAGDFLEIPLHLKHDVKVLSPYVVAVLQYRFV